MKIVESFITKNGRYTNPIKLSPKGIVLHSIGVNQPKASVIVNNFNKATSEPSVHAVIDANDGTIYQTLPYEYKAYHVGGTANSTHIGVEMCEPSNIKYTAGATFTCSDPETAKKYVETAYNSAVEYFAFLCEKFGFDPLKDGVILSHKEANARGLGSPHSDPEHLWTQLGMKYTMDGFRKDVAKKLSSEPEVDDSDEEMYRVRKSWEDASSQIGAYKKLGNATKMADKNPGYNVYDKNGTLVYAVDPIPVTTEPQLYKVDYSNLNIRTGPSTNYPTTGKFTGKGTFTIVEIQNGSGSNSGWGLLKAYADNRNGWISLDYAKKL